jgi:hypothetical protein
MQGAGYAADQVSQNGPTRSPLEPEPEFQGQAGRASTGFSEVVAASAVAGFITTPGQIETTPGAEYPLQGNGPEPLPKKK